MFIKALQTLGQRADTGWPDISLGSQEIADSMLNRLSLKRAIHYAYFHQDIEMTKQV